MSSGAGNYERDESFRDSISTVDEEGKRNWIFPKKPKGRYYNIRTYVSWALLAILFSGPFIRINGEPLLMLNILERKFVIFGNVFWPQDFFIFGLGMITLIVFIVLFTAVFGRLFCGWVCPQTIFMEMVFRKIEYWIDGDFKQQKRLTKQKWNGEKIRKRLLKHSIFYLISFIIANTFLAYIIGSGELISIVTDPPSEHVAGLSSLLVFTTVFYFVFSWFREQVCTVACPYGRLQGVLLDRESVVVAYDYVRGEPRGKFDKREDRSAAGKGDCIACMQCVHVCPTGIDIRNGTQLECVNCTACIDACDNIMESVGLPKGLIRYDSEEGIEKNKKFKLTTRAKVYSAILVVLLITMGFLVTSRTDVETSILRTPGMLYQERTENTFSNLYNVKVVNKTRSEIPVELKLIDTQGKIEMVGDTGITVNSKGVAEGAFFIILPKEEITSTQTKVKVGVYKNGELIDEVSTNFLGPAN